MLKLSVTTAALLDLEQAHEWITQDGAGPAAAARYEAIIEAIEYLAEKPQTWRDGDEPGTQNASSLAIPSSTGQTTPAQGVLALLRSKCCAFLARDNSVTYGPPL